MPNGRERSDVITYRSRWSSFYAAFFIYVYGFVLILLISLLFDSTPWIACLLLPLPFAIWRGATVSVTLGVDEVVIRNVTRTHRVRSVVRAIPERRGPRGQSCVTFASENGKAIPAFAMLVWSRGVVRERPTASAERLAACLRGWADECREQRGVEVQLDPTYIQPGELSRQRFAFARDQMSLTDPVESLRTVRRALVGSSLISIRPTADGFRVYVDDEDGSLVSESVDFPTMDSAIEAGIAEVSRRT